MTGKEFDALYVGQWPIEQSAKDHADVLRGFSYGYSPRYIADTLRMRITDVRRIIDEGGPNND
jgi:hypothetical protein